MAIGMPMTRIRFSGCISAEPNRKGIESFVEAGEGEKPGIASLAGSCES